MLLVGSWEAGIAQIKTCVFTIRQDKKKDRVEISSEKLSEALDEAERLGLRVIGWCHSHPRITVWPSHVDLKTQRNFQTLDSRFFGLIYSCFHENTSKSQRLQTTSFQTSLNESGQNVHLKIPLIIMPTIPEEPEFLKIGQVAQLLLDEELHEPSDSITNINRKAIRISQIQEGFHFPMINLLTQQFAAYNI